jgi:hypothetical protein
MAFYIKKIIKIQNLFLLKQVDFLLYSGFKLINRLFFEGVLQGMNVVEMPDRFLPQYKEHVDYLSSRRVSLPLLKQYILGSVAA